MAHFMHRPESQIDTPQVGYQPTIDDLNEAADYFETLDGGDQYDPFEDPTMGDEEEPAWWDDDDPTDGEFQDLYGSEHEHFEYPE